MATQTWTGTTSGAWDTVTNWSGGVIPANGDSVIFPSSPTTAFATGPSVPVTINNLTDNYGKLSSPINFNGLLTVTGTATQVVTGLSSCQFYGLNLLGIVNFTSTLFGTCSFTNCVLKGCTVYSTVSGNVTFSSCVLQNDSTVVFTSPSSSPAAQSIVYSVLYGTSTNSNTGTVNVIYGTGAAPTSTESTIATILANIATLQTAVNAIPSTSTGTTFSTAVQSAVNVASGVTGIQSTVNNINTTTGTNATGFGVAVASAVNGASGVTGIQTSVNTANTNIGTLTTRIPGLITISGGSVNAAVQNFPSDFLSSTEQTQLANASTNSSTLATRIPGAITVTSGSVNALAQNLPTDYQQRAVAVTLPTTAPTGYGGGTGTSTVTEASIIAALEADANWQKLVAYCAGKFDFNPSTGVFRLYAADGTTVLRTFTLTKDTGGNTTLRTVTS